MGFLDGWDSQSVISRKSHHSSKHHHHGSSSKRRSKSGSVFLRPKSRSRSRSRSRSPGARSIAASFFGGDDDRHRHSRHDNRSSFFGLPNVSTRSFFGMGMWPAPPAPGCSTFTRTKCKRDCSIQLTREPLAHRQAPLLDLVLPSLAEAQLPHPRLQAAQAPAPRPGLLRQAPPGQGLHPRRPAAPHRRRADGTPRPLRSAPAAQHREDARHGRACHEWWHRWPRG